MGSFDFWDTSGFKSFHVCFANALYRDINMIKIFYIVATLDWKYYHKRAVFMH